MKRTISAMVGEGSVNHNSRKFHAQNTDPARSHLNINYCNENIKAVYHELFDEALKRYNERQTRADRKIENYYKKICSGNQEKPFHELILQIGNKDNMSADSEDGQLAAVVLDEYMRGFQERNPQLRVFSAHLHMDEATPHLHIDFVPFTTGSKRGLDTRVSLKQALASRGFKGGTRGDTEWNQWVRSEKEQLAAVMQHHGIEWEHLDTHNQHLSVLDFKKHERQVEIKELEQSILKLQRKQVDVQAVEQVEAKSVPLTSKVMMEREDYQLLITAAQKYVVQEKKESDLVQLLKAAKKTIAELKVKVAELTRELDGYRSIQGQLQDFLLKKENKELKQKNSLYRNIIESNGLSHLLVGRYNKQKKRDAR